MKTWYHVTIPGVVSFGFCVENNIVVNIGYEYNELKNCNVKDTGFRDWFISKNAIVIKVM